MIRAHLQSIVVAVATFSVVTGGIVGIGLVTADPLHAEADRTVSAIKAAPDVRPVEIARAAPPRVG